MIAPRVFIATHKHNWKLGMFQDEIKSWQKGDTKIEPVSIGSNVWIGPNCSIESGVYLGHHSIVGANTFVPKGIYKPYSMIIGNPLRIIDIREQLDDTRKAYLTENYDQN